MDMLFVGIILATASFLAIISIVVYINSDTPVIKEMLTTFCSVTMLVIGIGLIIASTWQEEPEAIDVYRGKTELKIKQEIINDEIVSMDTTVVWKQ